MSLVNEVMRIIFAGRSKGQVNGKGKENSKVSKASCGQFKEKYESNFF